MNLFNDIFIDLERILASNKAFLLGNWLEAAKAAANTTEVSALLKQSIVIFIKTHTLPNHVAIFLQTYVVEIRNFFTLILIIKLSAVY